MDAVSRVRAADVAAGDQLPEQVFRVTRADLVRYAGASGDLNPIHWSDRVATSVGLPGVIAHGMLQMGILATVAAEATGGPEKLRRMSVRFAGMVVPGDTVTFGATPDGEGKLDLSAVNQRGEAVLTKAAADYRP